MVMRSYMMFIRFIASGLTSFLIDIMLFALFVHLLDISSDLVFGPVAIATAISRIISAHYNYLVNRFLVFKIGSGYVSYVRYFCCVFVIGTVSWLFTGLFAKMIDPNGIVVTSVKIIVDVCLFVVSYFAQRNFVFNPRVRQI